MKKLITLLFEKYCDPKKWMKDQISKSHGSIELKDGTFIVNQSASFHYYCYGTAYQEWKKTQSQPKQEIF